MLSTSDTGNEDDRDSDSGGELLADRPLGKTPFCDQTSALIMNPGPLTLWGAVKTLQNAV